ncbi:riboflavin synthase [Granulicoccus sp. GXG6511]|uniref:riboflavin synthase n=1 Tax=Granulicoccus sp. GXG6511 TaxID=3381351 RepID=UPI003D7D8C77
MFTGIVEELGEVRALTLGAESATLTLHGPTVVSDARHGASISVNGVCLTVVAHDAETFTVDVMAETLKRSSLGALRVGDPVNLERAMRADGRFGGHLVQGHVDGVAEIVSRTPGENWEVVRIALPESLARYVVEKGSIAVDGVSLTVSDLGRDDSDHVYFEVSLIPTTLELTTLGRKQPGEMVNLEVDVLAKYVERLTGPRDNR